MEGTYAADSDRGIRTGPTGGLCDLKTRSQALQRIRQILGLTLRDLGAVHRSDGTRNIPLLLCTVTYYNNVFQIGTALGHDRTHRLPGTNGFQHIRKSDGREHDDGFRIRYLEAVTPFLIRQGSGRLPLHTNTHALNRLSGCVLHDTGDRQLLRLNSGKHNQSHHQAKPSDTCDRPPGQAFSSIRLQHLFPLF